MTPEKLAEIHKAAFHESRSWESVEFSSLLDSRFCFYVGDSRGFALGRVIADESELLTIAVHPKFRGQNLGRLFLKQYFEISRLRGAAQAFLEVAEDNDPALNLYLSSGYKKTSCRKMYYERTDGTKVDALILTKDLA